ncbi:MAG TPA: choice-of-anchor X domain-containing protein, partial [Pyrinomonadaceae bacterium]|nr:choice-of-anchor X domain-containing protein [Pyrinomonadaceae bacterium]
MHSIIAAQNAVLIDYTSREDFQGDGLGQWASYPPAQDIGYEPSITPTREFDPPGGRGLMRWVQPTRAGDFRFGFIRKVDLVTNAAGRIAFDYRINAPTETVRIEVGVAGADGYRYTADIVAITNRWAKASIGLGSLNSSGGKPLANGIGVEAVYLVAKISKAGKDSIYRFLIDNTEVTAAGPASFNIVVPQSSAVPPWTSQIAALAYRPGDAIRIEARAPLTISRASTSLVNQEGQVAAKTDLYDDGTHGDARAKDGTWTNDAVHKFAGADAPGVWRAELNGTTADGRSISTTLRFLVHPGDRASHPRLYFDSKDKAKLIARTGDPNVAKVWEYI